MAGQKRRVWLGTWNRSAIMAGALAVLFATLTCPARGQAARSLPDLTSGNGYLAGCTDEAIGNDAFTFGLCFGYVSGFLSRSWVGDGALAFCMPDGVPNGQRRDILLAYIKDHPADRHRPLGTLAIVAYMQAFPCAASKQAK